MVRIISDPFPLPSPSAPPVSIPASGTTAPIPVSSGAGQRWGRYGCSAEGLVLAAAFPSSVTPAGDRGVGELDSGTLLELPLSAGEKRDLKSGALLLEYTGNGIKQAQGRQGNLSI
jgi:hypothetical protein